MNEAMSMKSARDYDVVEYLETTDDMAAYLNAALEDGDPAVLSAALGDIARAKGMTRLSRETGVSRDGLYKALSPSGNPSFAMVKKVLETLNLKIEVVAASAS